MPWSIQNAAEMSGSDLDHGDQRLWGHRWQSPEEIVICMSIYQEALQETLIHSDLRS